MEALDLLVKIFSFKHSVILLLIVLSIITIIKSKDVIELLNWIFKRRLNRSCGDCLLIMFGIREKYELESNRIQHNILKSQMCYFEQKSQEVLLWLTQSFQDDIEILGKDKPGCMKVIQFGNYQESLKNAMEAVKTEFRRSCKENGFVELSDNEFSTYVKSKTKTLISIAKSYLSTYYTQTEETIVTLKYRFEKLDYNRLTDLSFDIFGYAKSIIKESESKEQELKEKFKTEIDLFVNKNKV
jgi:hypothetical protein